MKQNNFVITLSPQQQYEIRRWLFSSLILCILSFVILVGYFAPQLYALFMTKKEISCLLKKTHRYTELTTTKNALKKQNKELNQKRTRINHYTNNPKNPHTYITTIINAGNNATIEQIRVHNKDIEIIAVCPTTENATVLSQQLTDTPYFTNTKVTSLQQLDKKNQFKCTIKGNIKKV